MPQNEKPPAAGPGGQEKASTGIVAQAASRINPEAETRQALRLLFEPGQVVELRSLNTRWKTVSGYFDDMDKLARAALSLDGKVPAVYITLNPVDPALLARAANRLEKYAKETTQDHHILRRRWIGFDFDPVRPSGVSSTDAEHEAALERARQVRDWLRERGWPDPILADSGNGAHLLYRIDLPNDPETLTLVNRCLEAVAFAWEDARITVDQKVGNASRIWKLWGTMACKGDNVPDRPHRRSRVLEAPERLDVVPRELLEELAATCPDEDRDTRPDPLGVIAVTPDPGRPRSEWRQEPFALERWIQEHNLPVVASGPWRNGGWRWVINPCPWNPEHTNRAAYIVRLPNGAIQAGCHHNGCRGKDWHALRDLVEPGWRERKAQAEATRTARVAAGDRRGSAEEERQPVERKPVLIRAATVTPEPVEWLWEPYIPLKKLTIVEGDPGQGKTWTCLQLAAIESQGWAYPGPDGFPRQNREREPGNVIYMSAEDDPEDTLRPRLEAAGANLEHIFFLQGWRGQTEGGEELSGPVLLSDIPMLEEAIREIKPRLIVIDPLQAYLGAGVDMHRANETRPVLARLRELAREHRCAIVLIRHLSKATTDRSIYRGLGSIDIAAAVRSALLVAEDPERPGHYAIIQHKNSLAAKGPAIGFTLEGGRFAWTGLSCLSTAVLWTPELGAQERGSALQEAMDFLSASLEDGPRPAKELLKEAKKAGIEEITLRRAKKELGVQARRQSGKGATRGEGFWVWELPQDKNQDDRNSDQDIHTHEEHLNHHGRTPTAPRDFGYGSRQSDDYLGEPDQDSRRSNDYLGKNLDRPYGPNGFPIKIQDDHRANTEDEFEEEPF